MNEWCLPCLASDSRDHIKLFTSSSTEITWGDHHRKLLFGSQNMRNKMQNQNSQQWVCELGLDRCMKSWMATWKGLINKEIMIWAMDAGSWMDCRLVMTERGFIWIDGWIDPWLATWMGGCMNEWIEEWMDEWMNKWMGGWNDMGTYIHVLSIVVYLAPLLVDRSFALMSEKLLKSKA